LHLVNARIAKILWPKAAWHQHIYIFFPRARNTHAVDILCLNPPVLHQHASTTLCLFPTHSKSSIPHSFGEDDISHFHWKGLPAIDSLTAGTAKQQLECRQVAGSSLLGHITRRQHFHVIHVFVGEPRITKGVRVVGVVNHKKTELTSHIPSARGRYSELVMDTYNLADSY
jgi:hypothetical protein